MTSQLRQPPARYRMLATRGALVAACGVLAAACGSTVAPSSSAGSASPGSTAGPAGTTSASKVSLNVTLAGANGPSKHWTLRCDPPGGTSADPAAACAKLLAARAVLQKQHLVKVMCPMIMADARAFTITGTFFGQKVHETVVDGGCQLSRWSTLNHIFN